MSDGKFAAALIGGVVTFLFLLSGAAYVFENARCSAKAEQMGVPYQFGIFTGCMVKHNGQWVPIMNLRVL